MGFPQSAMELFDLGEVCSIIFYLGTDHKNKYENKHYHSYICI